MYNKRLFPFKDHLKRIQRMGKFHTKLLMWIHCSQLRLWNTKEVAIEVFDASQPEKPRGWVVGGLVRGSRTVVKERRGFERWHTYMQPKMRPRHRNMQWHLRINLQKHTETTTTTTTAAAATRTWNPTPTTSEFCFILLDLQLIGLGWSGPSGHRSCLRLAWTTEQTPKCQTANLFLEPSWQFSSHKSSNWGYNKSLAPTGGFFFFFERSQSSMWSPGASTSAS